jgi:integrase
VATFNSHTDQNGKTTWRARVRVKGHPIHTKTFSTKTAAKKWAQSLETKLREGASLAFSEAQKHTLAQAIGRYSETVLPGKAENTRSGQEEQLSWWREHYGDLPLSAVTTPMLVEAREKLSNTTAQRRESQLRPSSVNRYLAAISHVLRVASREWYWIPANPMDQVSRLKENNARDRYLSAEELRRLIDACRISESEHLYLAVLLTLTTGARQMEVMGLTWRDLDLTAGTVTFRHTKNRTHRAVGLVPELVELLKARRGFGADLVFPAPLNPKKPDALPHPVDLRSAWETALRRAGIEDFRWHDLRHTAASYLAMEGASGPEIAAVLGHRTLSMVRRYAHLSPQHTAQVATKIGNRVMGGLADE